MDIHCSKIAALTASVILASVAAGARDWYVAPGGADGGAGTIGEPLATVAHAVSRASAGDSILLERGGSYFASDLSAGSNLSVLPTATAPDRSSPGVSGSA